VYKLYMQPTPPRLCWMARPTTVLSEDINLHKKLYGWLNMVEHGHEHDVVVEEFAQSVYRVFKKQNSAHHRTKLFTAI